MAQLEGKIIAITGAGSGIGLATAVLAAKRGAAGLSLCDINEKSIQHAVDEIQNAQGKANVQIHAQVVDVSKSDQVDAWIAGTIEKFGRIDGAANVAGIESGPDGRVFKNIVDITNEHWDRIIGVNATGLFYCVRAELRVMGKGGSIMNVASMAGLMGRPSIAAYSTSKHAAIGLTRTAAKEVGPQGIRVNALAP
jgi:NAD(P)-dependent dehydrogenase (short-subunit alcohol dehydrogenase family)